MRALICTYLVISMATLAQNRREEPQLTGRLTEVALGYQRMLQQDPGRPDALLGMSLVALTSHQPADAIAMARAAVAVAPRMGVAWVMLGKALKSAGRLGEAEVLDEEAICLDGMDALARLGRGELMMATGRPEEALEEYNLALRRQPAMVAAHMSMGHALASLGRNSEALGRYEQALVFASRLPEAEFAAAFVLTRLGRRKEAEIRYRRALAVHPGFAAVWMNLGCLLREDGREIHAEAALLRAVELRPDMITGWINLALLKREQRRPVEAEGHLRAAFALDPGNVEVLVAWCQFRAAEGDLPGAREWLRWALARGPANAEAVNMGGSCCTRKDGFPRRSRPLIAPRRLGARRPFRTGETA